MKNMKIKIQYTIATILVIKSFSHFLDISLGSSFELQTQLLLANNRKYLSDETTHYFENKIEEFQKATMSFQNTLNE